MPRATRLLAAAAAGTALTLVGGGVALADSLRDNLNGSAENQTITADGSVTVTYWISAQGTCDVNPDSPGTMQPNPPQGVIANPTSVQFTACGENNQTRSVTYSSSTPGTYAIAPSFPQVTTITVDQADFSLRVNAPVTTNTAPSVTVRGVTDGAEYVIGWVPAATCDVTDAQQPDISSFAATLSGTLTNGLGSQTATCSFTDAGGLSDTKSVTYLITAPPNTKPSVSVTGVTDGASYEIGSVPAAGCDVTDAEDVDPTASPVITGTLTHGLGTQTATCDHTDEGGLAADTATATYTIVDTGDPTISGSVTPTGPDGSNGWYKSNPTVTFTCADTGSGTQSCVVDGQTTASTTLGEGADQSVSGTATDWAGNTATATVSNIDVDMTNPSATFDSTIGTVYFGAVPPAPTCSAADALSGPDGCEVTGYSTAIGTHTLTATAIDMAGRTGTATTTYTVSPWTLKGFYSPADMGGVWNTVKGGSTVPLKFEAFAASELTDVSAVKSFKQQQVTCPGGSAVSDAIEVTSTGGTSLRYDATGGQFIQNWATPKKPGTCYAVTMTTQDGSVTSANFALR